MSAQRARRHDPPVSRDFAPSEMVPPTCPAVLGGAFLYPRYSGVRGSMQAECRGAIQDVDPQPHPVGTVAPASRRQRDRLGGLVSWWFEPAGGTPALRFLR